MENTNTETMALAWPDEARAIIVSDQESYDHAAKALASIANTEKEVKAHHAPMKTTAHEAHRAAVAAEKRFLNPLNEAKKIIKSNIVQWTTAQAKIQAEADRKAREEAERKEEDERLARAEEAEKAGKSETEVEEIIDTPAPVKVAPAAPTYEKAASVSTRETWSAEVTDLKSLCKAVAEGNAPIQAVQANMPFLNSIARSSKSATDIPGVKAVMETNVVTR